MKEALKLALEALNWSTTHEGAVITHEEAITAIKAALAQQDLIEVSSFEFVTRVIGKEDVIGKPMFWAKWPSKEKNT
jgi:hypothetical protein